MDGPDDAAPEVPNSSDFDPPLADLLGEAGLSADLHGILAGPQAPLRLPSREELEVRLVTKHQLDAAFQAAGDKSLFLSALLLGVGALIGFITNLATADSFRIRGGQIGFLTGVGVSVLIFGVLTFRAQQRAKVLRGALTDATKEPS